MKVTSEGLALWVEAHPGRRGNHEGPPILLLHGFTGSVEAWGRLPARLARHGPVLAVDLPGHGRSDVPADPARTALERVVDDVCRVLDARGWRRAVWVGYSMGGRVALGAAVLRAERVAGLVLESASPGLADPDDRRARRERDEALAAELERDGLEAFVDRWMSLPLFRSQTTLPRAVRAAERARRLTNSVEGLARSLRGLGTGRQPSFWDDLTGVDVPTLLLTGTLDVKFTRLAAAMASRLPHVRRRQVPGVGHTVHLEAPERWLEAVGAFYDEVCPPGPAG